MRTPGLHYREIEFANFRNLRGAAEETVEALISINNHLSSQGRQGRPHLRGRTIS